MFDLSTMTTNQINWKILTKSTKLCMQKMARNVKYVYSKYEHIFQFKCYKCQTQIDRVKERETIWLPEIFFFLSYSQNNNTIIISLIYIYHYHWAEMLIILLFFRIPTDITTHNGEISPKKSSDRFFCTWTFSLRDFKHLIPEQSIKFPLTSKVIGWNKWYTFLSSSFALWMASIKQNFAIQSFNRKS